MNRTGDIETRAESVVELDKVMVSDSVIQQGLGTEQRLILEVGGNRQRREFRENRLIEKARNIEERGNRPDVPRVSYC